jgi:predicted alpha-1,2-mannosidase
MEDSVPQAFHKKEQVSRTLEYAYDDYAVSILARSLGNKKDYRALRQRAFNYKNVFDTAVGMVRGRYTNGSWYAPFHADAREPYITEGTPRQYSFYVPQDVPGMASLMGGTKKLEDALDSLFSKNEYWHGNEPGHQIPFMYNYTASPWKTQRAVSRIRAAEYTDGPGGLSGNDDAGQMSAWYIFAAMGFYPVNPVSGEYLLCTPLFGSIGLHLQGGKQFRIVCRKNSAAAVYIASVKLNGKSWQKNFIRYTDIMKGGLMIIQLQESPSTWGSAAGSRPVSAVGH